MTIVPRTGPLSASSALATTSWYHLGKSSDFAVKTALAMGCQATVARVSVRVLFSPAPTGYLHVGSARSALFNWLYARHTGGTFALRIEDTDAERSKPELTEVILRTMAWLGLDWDEGPVFQSQRHDLYVDAVDRLLADGRAYLVESVDGADREVPGSQRRDGLAVRFRTPE